MLMFWRSCARYTLLVVALYSSGVNAELTDIRVLEVGDTTTVEIVFSQPFTVVERTSGGERNSFSLRLLPTDLTQATANDSADSRIDIHESHHAISSVTLLNPNSEYAELLISLEDDTHVEILPQYTNYHVLLILSSAKTRRRLERSLRGRNKGKYTITLESRLTTQPTLADVPRELAKSQLAYIVPFRKQGATWQRLRVGFWHTKLAAKTALVGLQATYPDAWTSKVSPGEEAFALAYRLNPDVGLERAQLIEKQSGIRTARINIEQITPSSIKERQSVAINPVAWNEQEQEVVDENGSVLRRKADDAFRLGDYQRAIQLYTKLLNTGDSTARQHALEMLGTSRELNRQLAHAAKRFREYLAFYSDSPGANRVRQRLANIVALTSPDRPELRAAKRTTTPEWRTLVSVSQFYQRHALEVNNDRSVPINGLFSDINVDTRKVGGELDHQGRLSLSYLLDFTGDLGNRDIRIGSAYWDSYSTRIRTGVRVGRQSKFDAGVIGRFDGVTLSHRLGSKYEVGAVGGFLLDSTFDTPNTDRPFYGIYGKYTNESENLTFSPFVTQQTLDGQTDRRAVGFQSYWTREQTLFLATLDYDLYHSALNNAQVQVNLGIGTDSSFNFGFEQRRSPYLTTRNALIGQPFEELSELETELIDLSLRELADDRTAVSRSLRAGWNRKLSARWELTADVLANELSSTESSMNVTGFSSRQDMYYSIQLRAQDIWGEATYSGLTFRFADSQDSSSSTLFWSNRLTLGEKYWLYPRLRLDYRSFDRDGQSQYSVRPSVRLDYRYKRNFRFEFESGYELTTRETVRDDIDISGFFIRAGYRIVF